MSAVHVGDGEHVRGRRLAHVLVSCGLLLLGAIAAAATTAVSELEVEVWSALIDHGLEPDARTVFIAEQTTGDPAAIAADAATAQAIVKQLEVPQDAFDDWARRNAAVSHIDQPLKLKVSYQVLSAKTLAELYQSVDPVVGWKAFFERYAGTPGLLRLSHVGFDPGRGHALVYLEHQCGAECGAGRLFHLTRTEGGWTVAGGAVVWMVK